GPASDIADITLRNILVGFGIWIPLFDAQVRGQSEQDILSTLPDAAVTPQRGRRSIAIKVASRTAVADSKPPLESIASSTGSGRASPILPANGVFPARLMWSPPLG